MAKRISVTKESDSGRNLNFRDNHKGTDMTRAGFVRKIENGGYDSYHVREIHGIKTPVSNPDKTTKNNLD